MYLSELAYRIYSLHVYRLHDLSVVAHSEQDWHFANQMENVLKARSIAGDAHAIDYDVAFQQRVSHNELTGWDLLNDKIWLLTMGPSK